MLLCYNQRGMIKKLCLGRFSPPHVNWKVLKDNWRKCGLMIFVIYSASWASDCSATRFIYVWEKCSWVNFLQIFRKKCHQVLQHFVCQVIY